MSNSYRITSHSNVVCINSASMMSMNATCICIHLVIIKTDEFANMASDYESLTPWWGQQASIQATGCIWIVCTLYYTIVGYRLVTCVITPTFVSAGSGKGVSFIARAVESINQDTYSNRFIAMCAQTLVSIPIVLYGSADGVSPEPLYSRPTRPTLDITHPDCRKLSSHRRYGEIVVLSERQSRGTLSCDWGRAGSWWQADASIESFVFVVLCLCTLLLYFHTSNCDSEQLLYLPIIHFNQ